MLLDGNLLFCHSMLVHAINAAYKMLPKYYCQVANYLGSYYNLDNFKNRSCKATIYDSST
jgi:hypothetical protein